MPLPAGIFITLIILIGGYLFLDATRSVIFGGNFRWLYLAILTGLSSFLSIKMPVTRKSGELYAIAVGDIFVFTGLLLFGVPVAVLLSGVEGIVLSLKAGVRTTYRLLFNAAHLVIAGWVMGEIFYALHGQPAPLNPVADQNAAILMVEIGVGGLIYFVLDMGLLSIAMSMASRQPISSFTHGFEWAAISHFSCASLGALIFLFFGLAQAYYAVLAFPMILLVYYTYRIHRARVSQTERHLKEVRALLAEKIEAEKALQKAYDLLEERVQQRTADLRKANRMLVGEINDRKAAQRALAAETERLRVTLRSIGEGVITVDTNGEVILLNKAAETLTGWRVEEAAGESIEKIVQIIDQRDGSPTTDLCRQVIETGEIVFLEGLDYCMISRDGSTRNVFHIAAPIRDDYSKVTGVVLTVRDITDQLRLESELMRAQKLESLGLLAGGIAHDFNNILSGILLKNQLAQRSLIKGRDPSKYLVNVQDAVHTATSLTQQLLTFAKGGAPIKQAAAVPDLLREASEFALRGSNVKSTFDFDPDLWPAVIDRGQISQVVHNLVINAAQAMPEGGTIAIKARNSVATEDQPVADQRDGSFIRIDVQDEGLGIQSDDLPRIFDPYFSTKPTGHGLGLTTTHSIVRRHGGTVSVTSGVGKGSCFSVFLPASSKQVEVVKTEHRQAASGEGRVLIMDDEREIREALAELLEELGYEVSGASDGEAALAQYRESMSEKRRFIAVIMDLTIPGGMGGKEAIGQLLEIDPQACAIVYSGYSKDPVLASFRDYGFQAMLPKPFQLDQIAEILANLIASQKASPLEESSGGASHSIPAQ